jgi:hypothetical protein
MTKEQIQALVDRGLLRPKTEVSRRLAAGEEFPTEGTGETVVFLVHIKRGFGVPTGRLPSRPPLLLPHQAGTSGAKLDHHHFYLYRPL